MDLESLSKLTKPIEKFIDVVSRGIGRVYKDTFGIKADAKRIKEIATARAQAKMMLAEAEATIQERMEVRVLHKELQRQNNIEAVTVVAGENMEDHVSEEPVDDDWITRFFNLAQDVSNEEMQLIWGKILAGEISNPNSYSFRTLETVKNLTRKDAEVFLKLCELVMHARLIVKINDKSDLVDYGITYEDILLLREAGLVKEGDSLSWGESKDAKHIVFSGPGFAWVLEKPRPNISFNVFALTEAGQALYKIINASFSEKYKADLEAFARKKGLKFQGDVPIATSSKSTSQSTSTSDDSNKIDK